jgi:hypothetical protein
MSYKRPIISILVNTHISLFLRLKMEILGIFLFALIICLLIIRLRFSSLVIALLQIKIIYMFYIDCINTELLSVVTHTKPNKEGKYIEILCLNFRNTWLLIIPKFRNTELKYINCDLPWIYPIAVVCVNVWYIYL